MTLLALLCVAAAARAAGPGGGAAPRPGLNLSAPSPLGPGVQALALGASFRGNYPALGAAFAEGMPGGLEVAGAGRFAHARVDWPGAGGRYDADDFQAALRWGAPVPGGSVSGGVTLSAGLTRGYARVRLDDGRYAFARDRAVWGEFAAGAGRLAGGRGTVAERYVRDTGTRTSVHATVFGLESPAWNRASILAEVGVFLANPRKWKTPWAAGLRLPAGEQAFDVFVANTPGWTVPGSLQGGRDLVYAGRLILAM
ncbi:MAG: hypothetical protein AAB152_01565 [Candidatus Coatesbacteria bacterium]